MVKSISLDTANSLSFYLAFDQSTHTSDTVKEKYIYIVAKKDMLFLYAERIGAQYLQMMPTAIYIHLK